MVLLLWLRHLLVTLLTAIVFNHSGPTPEYSNLKEKGKVNQLDLGNKKD